MGLGKTITTLALIAGDPAGSKSLIVCPLSVLGTWLQQIREHTTLGEASLFHSHNRSVESSITLTTYQTLASDVGNAAKSRLLATQWTRVVLDEAHVNKRFKYSLLRQIIRNRHSHAYAAAVALRTSRRWCLTGTPIQVWKYELVFNLSRTRRTTRFRSFLFSALVRGGVALPFSFFQIFVSKAPNG